MNFLNKIFHLNDKQASLKNEIIGGIITFIAMIYILPVNAAIMSDMGMNSQGVFAITAIVSCLVTLIMGIVANFPVVLSAGMGLNAFLVYTLSESMGFQSWQQKMILLTISGIIFFVFSLTPLRRIIIEAIPKDIRYIISACLGAFIAFVGLKGSGIIVSSGSTLVTMGNFANPGMLIAFVAIILCFGLMFFKNQIISSLAIPIAILFAAVVGVIVSSVMISNGQISDITNIGSGVYVYTTGIEAIDSCSMTLPIAPWINHPTWGASGLEDVVFFGALSGNYSGQQFVSDLGYIFTLPATYVAIFSLLFVSLFDKTATLIAVGEKTGMIDENGKMQNYRKAVIADATGGLICGPLGTSAVTPFAESNIGVSLGAKTGFSACIAAILFLLSAFIYPVFSIFTAGSVTAAALMCVGALILVSSIRGLDLKDPIVPFVAVVGILFSILTYSIANGIGVALLVYVIAMLIAGRGKEIKLPIYIIAALFVVSFALNAVITLI